MPKLREIDTAIDRYCAPIKKLKYQDSHLEGDIEKYEKVQQASEQYKDSVMQSAFDYLIKPA